MANTKKQKKEIEKDLHARFTHPSPSLKKKWEKRRKEKGNSQEVLDQEYLEWINEGQELKELKVNYKKRLADKLWSREDFQNDLSQERQVHLENTKLPLKQ